MTDQVLLGLQILEKMCVRWERRLLAHWAEIDIAVILGERVRHERGAESGTNVDDGTV